MPGLIIGFATCKVRLVEPGLIMSALKLSLYFANNRSIDLGHESLDRGEESGGGRSGGSFRTPPFPTEFFLFDAKILGWKGLPIIS